MAIQGLRGVVETAIQRASSATGVDFSFLMKTANRESSFNPRAKAATSSAAGLFQFTEQTWLSTIKQHGAKYGYARYADLITKGSDGRYHVDGAEARKAVMELRMDPHAASLMAGELASDHASYLRGRTGRSPTAGELYAAHFLGPQGSARLIEAAQTRPGASAASLFPDAAQSNKAIFYRDGRPATVAEVYANLTRTGGGAPAVEAPQVTPDQGFVQYASARNSDRLKEQAALVDLILRGPQGVDGLSTGGGSRGGTAGLASSMFSTEMLRVLSDARDDRKS
ncbi:transglycosylase SLT domain-containing protein [Phenylobacterium aquaticum]|uniref:transglycosylase SLT domain-containing protein n=1 Tax=Phenylobacterium aquaticum TaxID=1763816 RepID=UPI001F5D3A80|nr:transglycosylase SLT domain-containing protein [Phenylobacterium aquaticum]MCI3133788.1 transglycosylase SLT domain-containing protein [Phenylobacterium aquaticum]